MHTIRRIYLYAIAFISLETSLWGAIRMARLVLPGGVRNADALAAALSMLLVGAPVFFLHVWLAQRGLAGNPEERFSRERVIFGYGALLATLLPAIQNLLAFLERVMFGLLGLNMNATPIGRGQTLSDNLAAVLVNVLVAWVLYRRQSADERFAVQPAAESPAGFETASETRRIYRYLWLLVSLVYLIAGTQQLLRFLVENWLVPPAQARPLLGTGAALLLVGLALGGFVWPRLRATFEDPVEAQSLPRMLYFYGLVWVSALAALSTMVLLLRAVLFFILGGRLAPDDLVVQLSPPLSIAVPFGALWFLARRQLQPGMRNLREQGPAAEATLPSGRITAELRRRARLRRLYGYSLALFGLAILFASGQLLLNFGLDRWFGLGESEAERENLAGGLAALLVGLPIWFVAWRLMAREVAQEGEAGDYARRSLVRRGYMFLVIFASLIGVMYSAGMLLYHLLGGFLDAGENRPWLETLRPLLFVVLSAGVLGYHLWVLRRDALIASRTLARRHALYPVLVLSTDEGLAQQVVRALGHEAPGLPVAVHPVSQGAPDEMLSAARAVVIPAEVIARPPEAVRLWLQGFSGARLVIPTPVQGWHWVANAGKPAAQLARQAARAVRQLAEGEDPQLAREPVGLQLLAYVLAALFVLQILWLVVVAAASFFNF